MVFAQSSVHCAFCAGGSSHGGDIMALAGTVVSGFPDGFANGILGLCKWNWDAFTYPELNVTVEEEKGDIIPGSGWGGDIPLIGDWVEEMTSDREASTFKAKISPTVAKDMTCDVKATPEGKHKGRGLKETITLAGATTPTTFDVELEVTGAYHSKIVAAEQEHVDDLVMAYNLSIKAAADAVNSLVSQSFTGTSKADAEKKAKDAVGAKLNPKLGTDPANWRAVLMQLGNLTITQRDQASTHTFGRVYDESKADLKNKILPETLNDGSTRQFPSSDIIKL
jgi:hypothetical protein